MNRKSFYLEIGNIDDDLIQEASEARGHKKYRRNFVHYIGVAACFCLICTALFHGLHRDVVHYNETYLLTRLKVLMPEDATVVTMTYQELLDYYEVAAFPDRLSDLYRIEREQYAIYQSAGNIVYDENVLQYESADGEQSVSVYIAKEKVYEIFDKDVKKSRIDGVSVVFAASEETASGSVYWAELYGENIYLCIVGNGMEETTFTNIVREMIELQKNKLCDK